MMMTRAGNNGVAVPKVAAPIFEREGGTGRSSQVVWGELTILDGVLALALAACVFVYIARLENRTPHPLGDTVGAHKAVLAKLRKGEPMTQQEIDYASELVSDARSPLALAMPATLFCIGFFYVVGCLYMLHRDGGNPSFRTFVGGIPMLTSMNMAAQLRRVARLKGKLRDVNVIEPEPLDESATASIPQR